MWGRTHFGHILAKCVENTSKMSPNPKCVQIMSKSCLNILLVSKKHPNYRHILGNCMLACRGCPKFKNMSKMCLKHIQKIWHILGSWMSIFKTKNLGQNLSNILETYGTYLGHILDKQSNLLLAGNGWSDLAPPGNTCYMLVTYWTS